MWEALFPFGMVFGILAAVAAVLYFSYLAEKKRTEQFGKTAEELGLTFMPDGGNDLLARFEPFKLFNQGRSRKITNVVVGDAGDVAIAIFDYQYTTGSGKHQQTHKQTVVSLTSPHMNSPELRMRPEGFFDKIGSVIGFQDIDFDSHPEFSNLFVLQGSNEPAIRAFLVPRILELLETKKGICLEAFGNTMFFYKARTKSKPDQIKELLAEAYEIYNCILGDEGQ